MHVHVFVFVSAFTCTCTAPFRSEDSIMAVVPNISHFKKREQPQDTLRVPLFLARVDGIIYPTGMTFTYASVPGANMSAENGKTR